MGIFSKKESNNEDSITTKPIHHFSEVDTKQVGNIMALIKQEIYSMNNQITSIIRKFSIKYNEVDNPTYQMTYQDYRYLYEEMINLIMLKYIRQCDDTKRYFLKFRTLKGLNSKKKDNPVNIDFMTTIVYNSYLVSETLDRNEYKLIEDMINKSIQKISLYNNQIVTIEIKYYLQESGRKEITINDYRIMFNTQMYSTLNNIMVHSNICKVAWFKKSAIEANELENKK